jgi:Phytanoyl-CoA dioxygenase (PhyH)
MTRLRTTLRAAKKTDFVWRYVSNLRQTLRYATDASHRLTVAERGLVDQLDQDGIAVTSIDSLVDSSQFNELERSVADLLQNKAQAISELKVNAANEDTIGSKTFNLEMLGSESTFDPEDTFARFALNDSFLRIANAYLRMVSKLRYYNVWYTAASESTARESQLWHFDREDNYILKAFLYLDDVDEGAGPFTYAPGTHKKGKYRWIDPEFFLEGGVRRTNDEQMKAVFPEDRWVKGLGKKGTLIFADTRGFHKGGEARTKDRLMYTCMYTSPASESMNLIRIPDKIDVSSLLPAQQSALGIR